MDEQSRCLRVHVACVVLRVVLCSSTRLLLASSPPRLAMPLLSAASRVRWSALTGCNCSAMARSGPSLPSPQAMRSASKVTTSGRAMQALSQTA